MNLSAFAAAKIFSLPLYLIYTFIGASAHSFIKKGGGGGDAGAVSIDATKNLEENEYLIFSGILLSIVMMTLITRHIRKELMKVRTIFDKRLWRISYSDELRTCHRSWTSKRKKSQES